MSKTLHEDWCERRIKELRNYIREIHLALDCPADKNAVTFANTYRQRIKALEEERDRLLKVVQDIANGDTPWIDGYHQSSGQIYEAYAKQALEETP